MPTNACAATFPTALNIGRGNRLRLDQRVLNRLVLGLNAAVAFRRRRDVPFLDRRACYLGIYGESAAVWQARRVTGRDCLHREWRMAADHAGCRLTQIAARAAEVIVIIDPHMLSARRDKTIELIARPIAEVLNGAA